MVSVAEQVEGGLARAEWIDYEYDATILSCTL